jgi:hypothetical protein
MVEVLKTESADQEIYDGHLSWSGKNPSGDRIDFTNFYLRWNGRPWLSDKRSDPQERHNLAENRPEKLKEMQRKLRDKLVELRAPAEQLDRIGIRHL